MAFTINYYKTVDGSCPIREFIDRLEFKMQAKVMHQIAKLEQFGNMLREPSSKHIYDGIFELRVRQSSNIVRILYFFVVGSKIILTNGFVKKTQRTPTSAIALAKKYRADFLSREDNKL